MLIRLAITEIEAQIIIIIIRYIQKWSKKSFRTVIKKTQKARRTFE